MLTIVNISEKLFRQDVGEWRIGGIETHKNTYIILLRKPNGEKHQVNIERNPIGNEYEMWTWKQKKPGTNLVPARLMLKKVYFGTMYSTLTLMYKLLYKI